MLQMKIKNKEHAEKGITLIALIVTIIVLLILAGVTITNITSNEGTIQNAADVKNDSEKKEIQKELEMTIVTIFTEKGNLDATHVKSAVLDKFSNATIKNNDYPLEVVIDNTSFWIQEDTTVTNNIYEQKEYIKSTGTQYIDTGIIPANTVDFEITLKTDVNSMTVSNTGKESFFGASNSDIKRILSFNFGGVIGEMCIYTWKNNTYSNGAAVKNFLTKTYNPQNKITISCINDIWKVNNTQTATSASVGDWKDENNSLVVFGYSRIQNNVKEIRPFYENMYLYSLKIWDEGQLVRDFIPVESLENGHKGEACLYDLVGGKFYYNNGTGNFETNE